MYHYSSTAWNIRNPLIPVIRGQLLELHGVLVNEGFYVKLEQAWFVPLQPDAAKGVHQNT